MDERARRFATLFRGSPRGHGSYIVAGEATPGVKLEGNRYTAKRPATDEDFERHLAGTAGLGAVPLLLEPPGTTCWGAIDVDDYSIDVPVFARLVHQSDLPLVPCRTKSGGVHLYLLLSEPVETRLVVSRLKEWAGVVGFPNVEIFPKQFQLSADESEGSSNYYGNWINLPYQGGDRSTRYALDKNGNALSLDEFLDYAESKKLDYDGLFHYEAAPPEASPEYPGAPPCLVRMALGRVVSGGRNQALFTAAIYYRRLDPERCLELTSAFNRRALVPPLAEPEVAVIVRSSQKKAYNYRCREHPMAGLCNRAVCEEEKFGVRFGKDDAARGELGLELGDLVKIMTQPPVWRWEVDGEWLEFTTLELTTQKTFLLKVLELVHKRVKPVKPRAWEALLDDALPRARIEVPPPDATAEGQLLGHLNKFCTQRAPAKFLDEILLGKPYLDKDTQRVSFLVADLLAYLAQQRVTGITERWVYTRLRERELQDHVETLKGRQIIYWSMPIGATQTKPFDVPREDTEKF